MKPAQNQSYSYKRRPNFYQTTTAKLSCSGPDYIEVPGGSDTVPYTDDEGNDYEIPLDDLLDYDTDNEIEFDMKAKKKAAIKAKATLKDFPLHTLMMIASQKQRVYA